MLRYVSVQKTRHGKVVYYFRKRGAATKIRLRGKPGDAEFMAAYQACLAGEPLPQAPVKAQIRPVIPITDRKSLRWLVAQYLTSPQFLRLDEKTRRPRRRILEKICELPISDTNRRKIGDAPFEEMTSKAVRRIRDRKAETPGAANDYLKALKSVFTWAVDEEFAPHNPARDVSVIKVTTTGYHTWTIEEVEQFEAFHAIGTRPRLAFALLLYTGCRRSDVIGFGPQHIKDGELTYTQQKNRKRRPVTLTLPVRPELAAVIEATPTDHLSFLTTRWGKPYTAQGFSKQWRRWAEAAGLPHCSPHGLRKAGSVRLAENGATTQELMGVFGWRDIKQAERYTKAAEQRKLASAGMKKFDAPKSNVHRLSGKT
jgi:integrase